MTDCYEMANKETAGLYYKMLSTQQDLDLPIPYSCCVSTCKPLNWTEDYVCRDIKKDEVVNVARCMSDYHSNVTSSEFFHVQVSLGEITNNVTCMAGEGTIHDGYSEMYMPMRLASTT